MSEFQEAFLNFLHKTTGLEIEATDITKLVVTLTPRDTELEVTRYVEGLPVIVEHYILEDVEDDALTNGSCNLPVVDPDMNYEGEVEVFLRPKDRE